MVKHKYKLGSVRIMNKLFPSPRFADPKLLKVKTYKDVIRHYTLNSLKADGFKGKPEVTVSKEKRNYFVTIKSADSLKRIKSFGERHAKIFSSDAAQKAIKGEQLLKKLNVWNPMKNYYVNNSPTDGTSKWCLFPPLGLNVIGQKGLLLMHYPPWAIVQAGTFENAMTMQRWGRMLKYSGVEESEIGKYKTIIDINPIAAPGSGESEYPNDYFPIMMASGFFDGPKERDYIRAMLELYLSPPDLPKTSKYTLPLLICGSPLYDPQAPGWFRTAYTDILVPKKPKDPKKNPIPEVNVMHVGKFKVYPNSKRETPFMIANHMIAAGVTGRCTDDASKIPDIRQYEAQDLVAASFLKAYADNPSIDPEDAKALACKRWYGNKKGTGAPKPRSKKDQNTLCALAQMDLFFEPTPWPHPKYTFKEAQKRCKDAKDKNNPCSCSIGNRFTK